MTAEVAIMNRQGIALAADSAVTLGSGKIYNTADKLFALSKHHPVGVMIFGSAMFMGIPWETIIKCYRDNLKDKSFDSLSEYQGDFINYLSKFPHFSDESLVSYLELTCDFVFSRILNDFINEIKDKFLNMENIESTKIDYAFNVFLNEFTEKINKEADQKHIKLDEDFIEENMEKIIERIDIMFENYKLSDENKAQLMIILDMEFQKCSLVDKYGPSSGIVIAGYGEREIFPVCCSFRICGKLGKSLIYYNENNTKITTDYDAVILPFAQSEMVFLFAEGIDRDFKDMINDKISTVLNSLSKYINDLENKKTEEIAKLMGEYIDYIKQDVFSTPIINIVACMEKSELVSMAEAMVNLTALKRHVSEDEETVGGPVDVALITKNDGFIWFKKKTNYDPQLNRELNQNYFRSGKYGNL